MSPTEAPDMSPRPLFTPFKPTICGPLGLEPCWENPSGEVFYREALQVAMHEGRHVSMQSHLNREQSSSVMIPGEVVSTVSEEDAMGQCGSSFQQY